MTFAYPEPKQPANYIPGISMKWCDSDANCDNQGTMAYRFPDNETYVMTTDQATML